MKAGVNGKKAYARRMLAGKSQNRRCLAAAAFTLAVWLQSGDAQAYIDPGVTSLVMQWAFTAVFGTIGTWLVTPWNLIKQMFRRTQREHDKVAPSRED